MVIVVRCELAPPDLFNPQHIFLHLSIIFSLCLFCFMKSCCLSRDLGRSLQSIPFLLSCILTFPPYLGRFLLQGPQIIIFSSLPTPSQLLRL